MELRDYIRVLRRSWVLITALTLVGIAGAAGYSLLQKPEYQATTRMFVATQSATSVTDLTAGNAYTQQVVRSYAEVITTPVVLEPVITELGLDVTVGELASRVSASSPLDTVLIEVSVTDESPSAAANIANAIAASFAAVVPELSPDTESATPPVKVTTVEEARIPAAPISPRIPLNVALGALVGLALGIGLAVLRETLDTRVRGPRDVEALTDKPVIGGFFFDPKADERPLIVHDEPRSPRAEAFRTLRTNLQFLNVQDRPRSFVITSAVSGEGKSTTASNLAIALADSGATTVLIDADLRRPSMEKYLGIETAVGLTDVLIGRARLEDVLQPWGRTGRLFVLPAGQLPPNPSELLGSKAMATLIATLQQEFSTVLLDSPPLLPVTDAAVLARSTGGAIVVSAAGRTQRSQLAGALNALDTVGAPVLGLVLTMLPTKGPDAYGYGNYGYGYGYGYGYAAQPAQ